MIPRRSLICAIAFGIATCGAQTPSQAGSTSNAPKNATPTQPQPAPPPVPIIEQIRKSVTFIRLTCRQGIQEFSVRGTGFFVYYPDPRIGKDRGFMYLVTNRHVAMCWNESNQPMEVENISITMNRRQPMGGQLAQEITLNPVGNVPWIVPGDDSVDLAVFPFAPDQTLFDYVSLPTSVFVSEDLVKEQKITDGDSVVFAGFFYQFPGTTRMEPIVRQGTIAMIPMEKIPFINQPERVYLADLHAFGGNSGSPVFVNLAGFHNGSLTVGLDYRLLGVLNAEVTEDENFNLELTTTMKGKVAENSGVSTIVPADEIGALLDDPRLQQVRDGFAKVAAEPLPQHPN